METVGSNYEKKTLDWALRVQENTECQHSDPENLGPLHKDIQMLFSVGLALIQQRL